MGSSKKLFLDRTLESQKSYMSLSAKKSDFLIFLRYFDIKSKS